MGWEWMPETPEEIAEHQRMRKNLIECQQMDVKDDVEPEGEAKSGRSILVTLAVLFVLIYFLVLRK